MSTPWTATGPDGKPELMDRCSTCQIVLERVAIQVVVDGWPYVHLVCSPNCEGELRAQLEGE